MNNCHQKREKQQIPVPDPYPWITNLSYQPQMLPTNSEAGGRHPPQPCQGKGIRDSFSIDQNSKTRISGQ